MPGGYTPSRRTALVLVGEGAQVAYLTGAVKALEDAGVRFDLVLGKGTGALVAIFAAIQSGEKLYGPGGILEFLDRRRPWRLRAPYAAAALAALASFAAFVAPAALGALLLVALTLLAALRIIAPEWVGSLYASVQDATSGLAASGDGLYLRAVAFPIALVFAFLLVGWVIPALVRSRRGGVTAGGVLGEGIIDLAPLARAIERSLWEAVRGASVQARPHRRRDLGVRYRELLSASLGQQGFREIVFYALDLETGQEVPFVFLKDRWASAFAGRGPGDGAIAAEPVLLSGEGAELFFDAVMAALTPPVVAPAAALRLPLGSRHGGEVHRFVSSLFAGGSAVADAFAAGAEQVIYVSGSAATPPGPTSAGDLDAVWESAIRQALETDLREAERQGPDRSVFVVRPEKRRLGLLELRGRRIAGGGRLDLGTLMAHGSRDALHLFVRPMVGTVEIEAPSFAERGSPSGRAEDARSGPSEL